MVDAALWYFFGKVCMANAPQDCQRVVFDRPVAGNYLATTWPALTPPLSFRSYDECTAAIPARFALQEPLTGEGSRWVERGCTKE